MLWLSIRLPYLSLEALGYHYDDPAMVLVAEKNRVLLASRAAAALGIRTGMSVATAHALSAGIDAGEIDAGEINTGEASVHDEAAAAADGETALQSVNAEVREVYRRYEHESHHKIDKASFLVGEKVAHQVQQREQQEQQEQQKKQQQSKIRELKPRRLSAKNSVATPRSVVAAPASASVSAPGESYASSARESGLKVLERDLSRELQHLAQLAQWAYAFTPAVQSYQHFGLQLEIASCLKLFGGIKGFVNSIDQALLNQPYHYCLGLGHSASAAWLLSYPYDTDEFYEEFLIEVLQNACGQGLPSAENFYPFLASLPINSLECLGFNTEALSRTGLRQLSQLFAIPKHEVGKRFGKAFVQCLQELRGERAVPASYLSEEKTFVERFSFFYPVDDWQLMLIPVRQLLEALCEYLRKQQLQCSEIYWQLYSPQRLLTAFSISFQRAYSQAQFMFELSEIKFSQLKIAEAVESIELRCDQLNPVQIANRNLFADRVADTEDTMQDLIARLVSRCGADAVYQLQDNAIHIPEQAMQTYLPNETPGKKPLAQAAQKCLPRPLWLLQQPLRIQYRVGQLFWHGNLTLLQGPERIEAGWWQQPVTRDYFIACREDHVRCWIYHDLHSKHWFVQGLFA